MGTKYKTVLCGGEPIEIPEDTNIPAYIADSAERLAPEVFSWLYPRRYNNLGNFYSPKMIAGYLTDVVYSCAHRPFETYSTAHRLMLPALNPLMGKRMPYMFIASDLLEAIKLTDFPAPINWDELQLPYEQGIFVLPKGALVHPTDGDACCILYARYHPGEMLPPVTSMPVFTFIKKSFVMICLCHEAAIWYDAVVTDSPGGTVTKLNNLFYGYSDRQELDLPQYTKLDHKLTEVDSQFVEKMSVLLFGTLLAMSAKPALNTPAKLEKRLVDKTGAVKEFWSPNIIGKDYRLPKPDVIHGTHASPRMHWRRGHARQQPYGPKNSLRKSIWIEPRLIGAQK